MRGSSLAKEARNVHWMVSALPLSILCHFISIFCLRKYAGRGSRVASVGPRAATNFMAPIPKTHSLFIATGMNLEKGLQITKL